jgi:hypothetical protein
MVVQALELLKKAAILIAAVAVCCAIGLCVPLLFDRDVGGALAAAIGGILGIAVGTVVGVILIRRRFD